MEKSNKIDNQYIIIVNDLYKNFGEIKAVKGISFRVKTGSLFAFLGTNGAGKSTTISIISTLLRKTSGEVIVNGNYVDKNDQQIRNDIGVVFQDNLLDPLLTVKENVIQRGIMYGIPKDEIKKRMNSLSKAIDVESFLNQKYGTLSGGQKRRADIIRALINRPKVLILDEPTTGLDPSTRKKVWQIIQLLKQEQSLTIFLTTHYMEEAAIADQIVVINEGNIVASGTPEELRILYSSDRLLIIPKEEMREKITRMLKGLVFVEDRDKIIIELNHSKDAIDIINSVKNHIKAFEVIRGNLDDAFININEICERKDENNS